MRSGTELGQASICGGAARTSATLYLTVQLVPRSTCKGYVSHRLQAIPTGVAISVNHLFGHRATSTDLDQCSANKFVEVDASYDHLCYLPLLGMRLAILPLTLGRSQPPPNRFVLNEINPVKRRSGQSLLEYSLLLPVVAILIAGVGQMEPLSMLKSHRHRRFAKARWWRSPIPILLWLGPAPNQLHLLGQ